jgi:hypothetical protein
MNKSIIITGPRQSGKSKKAKELAEEIISREGGCVAYFQPLGDQDILKYNSFYSGLSIDTKVIVVDSIGVISQVESFLMAVTDGIHIYKRGEKDFMIFPTFIVVLVPGFKQSYFKDNSFGGRFDVVECNAVHVHPEMPFLGKSFISWANEYFGKDDENINCYSHLRKAYESFKMECKLDLTPRNFKIKLEHYCEMKGWVYNPDNLKHLCNDRRIVVSVKFIPVYRKELKYWILNPSRTQKYYEFFYFQTPGTELTDKGLKMYIEYMPELIYLDEISHDESKNVSETALAEYSNENQVYNVGMESDFREEVSAINGWEKGFN